MNLSSWKLTSFDKALIALVLPNIIDAVKALSGGLTLKDALLTLAVSILTGIGVYLKANA